MNDESGQSARSLGMWQTALQRLRLTWNLFWDPRVNFLFKIIPILTLGYIISPVDLMPALILGPLGSLDDIGVLLLGLNLFLVLVPPEIVNEHLERLGMPRSTKKQDDDVVDSSGEFVDE